MTLDWVSLLGKIALFLFYIPKMITSLNVIVDQLSFVVPVVSDRILPWSVARAGRQDYRNKETRVKKKILILYPPFPLL